MIKYSLKCVEKNCNKNEPFDGWFQNSASFEKQIGAGYISCPYCGSCLLYTSPSPRDRSLSRMPSSA